jgi:hypothetical protein
VQDRELLGSVLAGRDAIGDVGVANLTPEETLEHHA